MTWSIVPTSASANTSNPGYIDIVFTATDDGGNKVIETSSSNNWSVEKEIAHRQDMLARLKQQDTYKAQSAAYLPTVQAYIAGHPAPITG